MRFLFTPAQSLPHVAKLAFLTKEAMKVSLASRDSLHAVDNVRTLVLRLRSGSIFTARWRRLITRTMPIDQDHRLDIAVGRLTLTLRPTRNALGLRRRR